MKVWNLALIASLGGTSLLGCNSSSKQSGGTTTAPAAAASTTTTAGTSSSGDSTASTSTASSSSTDSSSSAASTVDADSWQDGYYLGFNGTDKFSVYLPSYRPMTVADTSIATITTESVTLSQATIDELIANEKKDQPDLDETRLRQMLAQKHNVQKLTPLKAGSTKLVTKSAGQGPGGGSVWKQGQSVVLVVTNYPVAQVAKGKARYNSTATEANKVACASCHETGANGAPPHELGDIMSLPDVSAEKWITTGAVGDRVASITHKWAFADADEELGTVAYLRTLQSADLETLTKLEFENDLANLPPAGDKKGGTTTSTGTTTGTDTSTGTTTSTGN